MCWEDDGGGTARGSAMLVMAWQIAQRMDCAPGGSCSGVRQLEQFTSINMAVGWFVNWMNDQGYSRYKPDYSANTESK